MDTKKERPSSCKKIYRLMIGGEQSNIRIACHKYQKHIFLYCIEILLTCMAQKPHVLIFPFPVQGHINCMLKLAELLCCRGLHVTFLNSHHIHERLLCCTDIHYHFSQYPSFHFETISDGLPADHPRTGDRVVELFHAVNATTKPQFRDILTGLQFHSPNGRPALTCIIADGIMSFTVDVAKELHIPTILFRTVSASCFWAFLCVPKLLEAGELPFNGENDMDKLLSSVPGLERFRMRDLPSFCRTSNLADPGFQVVISETLQNLKADGLLLNTFEDLEESALSHIRTHIPKLYTVGPLHAHLKAREASSPALQQPSSSSLWKEDRSCMAWLDRKPRNSVIYVSFGSMTVLTRNQLFEFWHGLVNSGKPFLWVIRPKSVNADGDIPAELLEGTRKRGYMVGWAPQQEVLAHPAVGGFLTHSGWNSTLESIYEGVPMICWPFYADQQVNSRLVGEVWKVGLDMKDTCERATVEKMIKDLMDVKRDEFMLCAKEKAKLARRSVEQAGSSHCNLDRLIDDINMMNRAK
ncbi:7-deoxyloganetic acid glucosyltransferase-like [Coffea arabica]|uniref:Glycosyltransferase n=1 Tax=Coffea arabica TaxID=13443 RepID=A0A6P6VHT0_COFAR|nr:7-deoxyloganetic acid glucosyltransferase-like [Coffea arabica]